MRSDELFALPANCTLDETLTRQRDDCMRAMPEVGVERALLVTDLHRQRGLLNLNYVYRFGFLAIEMIRWLPIPV